MADTDPTDPLHPPPTAPKPGRAPMSRAQLISAVMAVVFTAAVGVGAAFGFDVCAALKTVGVHVDACPVPAVK